MCELVHNWLYLLGYVVSVINPLGPIADIPAIISTICFRRHNLCKKCQNLAILKNTKNRKKTSEFSPRPVAKRTMRRFCGFNVYFDHIL